MVAIQHSTLERAACEFSFGSSSGRPMSLLGRERPIHGVRDESACPSIAAKTLHCDNRRFGP
jgi:hypothetical protein